MTILYYINNILDWMDRFCQLKIVAKHSFFHMYHVNKQEKSNTLLPLISVDVCKRLTASQTLKGGSY